MGSLKNKKYCFVDKFLTLEETKILTDYCRLKHRFNMSDFASPTAQSNNLDSQFYADHAMETLKLNKVNLMEK